MAISSELAQLFVTVAGDLGPLKTAFGQAKTLASAAGASIGGSMMAALGPVGAAIAGAFAVKEMISGAMEAQDELAGLASALRATGQEVDNNLANIDGLGDLFEENTRISGGAILALAQHAINLGVPAEHLEALTKSSVGLSTALGIDATAAMEALAKETQGVKSNLDRTIPALKGVEDQSQRLAIINKIAGQGLEQEAEQSQTLSGQMTILWNAIGKLGETLGGFLLPIIDFGVDALADLTKILQETANAFTGMEVDGQSLSELLRGVMFANIRMIGTVLQAVGPICVEVMGTIVGALNWVSDGILDFVNRAWTFGARIPELWSQWGEATSSAFASIGEWFSWLGGEISTFTQWALEGIGSFIDTATFTLLNLDLVLQEVGVFFADCFYGIKDRLAWGGEVISAFGNWLYENWSDIWRTVLDQSLTAVINWGDNLRSILSEAWDWIRSGGTDAFEPAIKSLNEGAQEFAKPFEVPEFKDSFDKDEARSELKKMWEERRAEWDAIQREEPLVPKIEAPDELPIIKATVDEDKKKGKDGEKAGTFSSLGEAFKRANSAALKAEEKRQEELLKENKKQTDHLAGLRSDVRELAGLGTLA